MSRFTLLVFSILSFNPQLWLTDFEQAKKTAQEKHQPILLTFSGSDWCGPCIRLHKEIFDTDAFTSIISNQLVPVNADFPRLKKNQLPKELQQQNNKLADQYNAGGNFPFTILLNAEGKIIRTCDGFPKEGAASFIEELNRAIHDDNQ